MEKKYRTRCKVSHAVSALDRKHIAMNNQRKQAVTITTRFSFPCSPGNGGRRIQIPVDRLWVQWFLLRYTDFQQKPFEGEDQG